MASEQRAATRGLPAREAMRGLLERDWRTAGAFALAFLATLTVAMIQAPKAFFADSGDYWTLGESFVREGHFSLLNFDNSARGYSLPLIYRELGSLAGELGFSASSIVKLFNSLVFASIGSWLGPRLAEMAWPRQRWGLWRRLALTGLLVVFWSGYLNFPLSDFPALVLVLATLVAAGNPDSPGRMLTAGLACALAINIRPGYLLLAPIVLGLVLAGWLERRGPRRASPARRTLCAILLVAGFVAISAPQSLLAARNLGTSSFIPGAAVGLLHAQFADGLLHQRYDSYEGPPAPSPLYIDDRAGARILAEQEGHGLDDWSSYLELIARHPIAMGGLFVRHFVNGLDARYTTPYVEHLDDGGHLSVRIAGFLIVFLALMRLSWGTARRVLGPVRWRYPLALLASGITSLASHMEVRYVVALYSFFYIALLLPGWPKPTSQRASGWARLRTTALLLAGALLFTAVVLHVTAVDSTEMSF